MIHNQAARCAEIEPCPCGESWTRDTNGQELTSPRLSAKIRSQITQLCVCVCVCVCVHFLQSFRNRLNVTRVYIRSRHYRYHSVQVHYESSELLVVFSARVDRGLTLLWTFLEDFFSHPRARSEDLQECYKRLRFLLQSKGTTTENHTSIREGEDN